VGIEYCVSHMASYLKHHHHHHNNQHHDYEERNGGDQNNKEGVDSDPKLIDVGPVFAFYNSLYFKNKLDAVKVFWRDDMYTYVRPEEQKSSSPTDSLTILCVTQCRWRVCVYEVF